MTDEHALMRPDLAEKLQAISDASKARADVLKEEVSKMESELAPVFRDVRDLLNHVVTLWFFATPIIYELALLPPSFQKAMRFNPMAQLIRGWQDALFFERAPSALGLSGAALTALVVAMVGYWLFDRLREVFPEEV